MGFIHSSGRLQQRTGIRRLLPLALLGILLCIGVTAMPVHADTLRIASFSQSGPDINGHFTYDYLIDFTGPASLSVGQTANDQWWPDFIEVFDFAGYVPGSLSYTAAPAGPGNLPNNSFTTQLALGQDTAAETALLPAAMLVDDPNIDNLKMNYADLAGASNPGVAPLVVGTLSAKSIFGVTAGDWYLSTETLSGGFSGVNLSGTTVPTPEPSAAALGLGLWVLAQAQRRRRYFKS